MQRRILINSDWEFALIKGFGESDKCEAEQLVYKKVMLPHDWAISAPFNKDMKQGAAQGYRDRWGIGWYRKNLMINKEESKTYRLFFDGIFENSTIWVNDVLVGGRKYGYSSFALDVTNVLKNGENSILVKVDNTQFPADRWYSGCGIYRNVYLEILPEEYLDYDRIAVTSKVLDDNKAMVIICADNAKNMDATVSLDNDKEYHGQLAADDRIEVEINGCRLWSAETPDLYELKLELKDKDSNVVDKIVRRIGIRDVAIDGAKGLFVNGKSTKLKGVCIHQDAGCFGIAITKEIMKERLLALKEIGCNTIRMAHHIFMPEMLDLCDELGFYVYEESFDKWTGGSYGRYYQTEWDKDITTMVLRDRNHPSIIIWGVGNEVENQAHRNMLELLDNHVSLVKKLDDTRPVSLAMNPHFAYPKQEEIDMSLIEDIQEFVDNMKTGEIFDVHDRVKQIKLIADRVDVISCNYQEQWYELIHEAIPDKAILGTETYMYFRGEDELFQNFSENVPWFDVVNNDYCIGGILWTGIDYLGESMCYPAKGWSGSLFATDMEKRPIAWQYQSYWNESADPFVHFAVMDYSYADEGVKEHWDSPRFVSHWEFPQFTKVVLPYMIATNCEQLELHVNEKCYHLKPMKEYPNGLITGYIPYLPGNVTVIGKNNGEEVVRQVVKTPKHAVKLVFEKEEMNVALETFSNLAGEREVKPYKLLLKVRAYDEDNNKVFNESAKVTFVVEGPARIIGVDNGDIKGAEALDNNFIHMYQGRADVALDIIEEGRVKVRAFCGGMKTAEATIVVE
ncbi:MAG: glycoside hydrolase family 2 protein [Lachnospiraceae bacterium]|nr:glycoside hydrolase family 2 protein [Lachnospiraceae bacterium]